MSRSPLVNVPQSNGHGRRQLGYVPVARQGNLIVSSSRTVTDNQLRQKLIDLVKEQGKLFASHRRYRGRIYHGRATGRIPLAIARDALASCWH